MMLDRYTVAIEQDGEWFIAYCLEVPGANGQGRTEEACRQSLEEAIKLILEDEQEEKCRKMQRRTFLRLAFYGSIAAGGAYTGLVEHRIVRTNHYRIPVQNLPTAFEGFRIVHLTDIHYGLLVSENFVRHVVRRANEAGGDIIVCTGDYVHKRNTDEELNVVWPLLSELKAPLGVYAVLGNHDHWASTKRSIYWLEQTGFNLRCICNRLEKGGEYLWLAGAGDYTEDHVCLDNIVGDIPEEDCRIVLSHNPDTADSHYTSRVDLMISGHTHGGQVVLPFIGAPVLPVVNKTYSSGLKQSPKGESVFISRGLGWAIAPVRFNCLPEIAVLELVRG
jgi:uncharacterized protein